MSVLDDAATKAVRADFKDHKALLPVLKAMTSAQLRSLAAEAAAGGTEEVSYGNGEAATLLPRHLTLQTKLGELRWARVRNGWMACAGAPSGERQASWQIEGVTAVVNLQHDEERIRSWEGTGVDVLRAPLLGKTSVFQPSEDDLRSLRLLAARVPELLDGGHAVVIHCAAGMHRTGAVAYWTLRQSGFNAEDALNLIAELRPHTHRGLTERSKKWRGRQLVSAAEGLLPKVLAAAEERELAREPSACAPAS